MAQNVINIDGDIVPSGWEMSESDVSPEVVRQQLESIGDADEIIVNLNSGGGTVFDGITIYNMLKNCNSKIHVVVQGLAASIASVIAMAGDEITMNVGSMIMIHNPWTIVMGNATDLREQANELDKIGGSSVEIYHDHTGMSDEQIQSLMDATTWMNADDAIAKKFADNKGSEQAQMKLTSRFKEQLAGIKNVPNSIMNKAEVEASKDGKDTPNKSEDEILAMKAEISNLKAQLASHQDEPEKENTQEDKTVEDTPDEVEEEPSSESQDKDTKILANMQASNLFLKEITKQINDDSQEKN